MIGSIFRSTIGKTGPMLLVLACLALFLPACAPKSGPQGSAADGKTQQLAYGVSITVPSGWVVESAIKPGDASKEALDTRVTAGERIILLSMHRPATGPEGKDAIIALFLVDSARNFQPEDRSAHLTQEELERYGQAILARDREVAAQNNARSNLLSWKVAKTLMDNKLTLVHRGTAQGPQGVLNLCDVNMYLPNGKGLALKSMSDPRVPGTEQIIDSTINSLRVQ